MTGGAIFLGVAVVIFVAFAIAAHVGAKGLLLLPYVLMQVQVVSVERLDDKRELVCFRERMLWRHRNRSAILVAPKYGEKHAWLDDGSLASGWRNLRLSGALRRKEGRDEMARNAATVRDALTESARRLTGDSKS